MTNELSVSDAWVWADALGSLRPRRVLRTYRESPKYAFFRAWLGSIMDGLTDGRPLLVNFHVGDTFVMGTKTKPGAIIYNCLFDAEGRRHNQGLALPESRRRRKS